MHFHLAAPELLLTGFLRFLPVSVSAEFHTEFSETGAEYTVFLPGAPRTARNPSEKAEPFGPESLKFANRYMQRDVEIGESSVTCAVQLWCPDVHRVLPSEFDSVDKTGGYIGTMYLNKTE